MAESYVGRVHCVLVHCVLQWQRLLYDSHKAGSANMRCEAGRLKHGRGWAEYGSSVMQRRPGVEGGSFDSGTHQIQMAFPSLICFPGLALTCHWHSSWRKPKLTHNGCWDPGARSQISPYSDYSSHKFPVVVEATLAPLHCCLGI